MYLTPLHGIQFVYSKRCVGSAFLCFFYLSSWRQIGGNISLRVIELSFRKKITSQVNYTPEEDRRWYRLDGLDINSQDENTSLNQQVIVRTTAVGVTLARAGYARWASCLRVFSQGLLTCVLNLRGNNYHCHQRLLSTKTLSIFSPVSFFINQFHLYVLFLCLCVQGRSVVCAFSFTFLWYFCGFRLLLSVAYVRE